MNDNMEWHVITSSKGGIGKTLLTLLLLAYYLEHKQDGSVLVLDLNGMNTDSTSILLHRKHIGNPIAQPLKTEAKLYQQGGDQIIFQKTYSITQQGQQRYYVEGCPLNPFVLYNPHLFADLLISIKALAPKIQQDLQLSLPLKYVFIDTNYHFCNLFGQDDSYYSAYQNLLKNQSIKIWFLWVYRQLEKLVGEEKKSNEATLVRLTANMIEKHLGIEQEQVDSCKTPFKHVFSPAALVTSRSSKKLASTLKRLYDAIVNQHDFVIPEFEALENKSKRRNICFEQWVEQLQVAYSDLTSQTSEEHALLFLPVLIEAIKKLTPEQRPENIMPISVYHPSLQQYTDKNRGDVIATVRKMKIYQHFSQLL